jgi:hypothetical protein
MEKISVKLCMALSRIQALDSWSDNAANCDTAMEKIQCRCVADNIAFDADGNHNRFVFVLLSSDGT